MVHRWRQIMIADWLSLIDAATKAYGEGCGPLDQAKVFELLPDGEATTFDLNKIALQPTGQPVEIPHDIVARPKKRSQ